MAAAPGSSGGPTVERIVVEAFRTAALIILDARVPSGPRKAPPPGEASRPWFNIEVPEVEGAGRELERWRREGPSLPLVLEVYLQPWGAQPGGGAAGTLLERWTLHYHPSLPEGPSHLSRSQLSRLNPASVYKRLVVTLRSLCTYVRVLPAYRVYRAAKRQRGASFTLTYRLHSTLPGSAAAAAPGARRMQSFAFGPVETPYGQVRLGVSYQPASAVTILEQTTSLPVLPQHLISDYVGGGSGSSSSGGGDRGSADGQTPRLHHAASAPPPAASPRAAGALAAQPGSSPHSLGRSPGGGFIRRSWSTSLRGVSPQRPLSQPPSELPSPVSRDTPYGSAPQAVSLPAMLRTLSTSASKYVVGSPSGRPPLAKPPRPAAAIAGQGGSSSRHPLGSSPASGGAGPLAAASPPLPAAAAEEDSGEVDSEMAGDSPCGSAGSGARRSAPVSIPGRGACLGGGPGGGRRLRSSGDLWALQQGAAAHKPLSAPAVSHMQQPAAARATGSAAPVPGGAADAMATAPGRTSHAGMRLGGGAGGAHEPPSPSPPARLPLLPGALDSESSGSAASSLYPTSCSPQLPFAFTPSAQSLASYGTRGGGTPADASRMAPLERTSPRLGRTVSGSGGASVPHQAAVLQMRALAAGGGGGGSDAASAAAAAAAAQGSSTGHSPSSGGSGGGVPGREVPASVALMRRPSWSSRSSCQLGGEASQPGVGYSVSPMRDATLESMLAGSTPRQFALAGGLPSPLAGAAAQPAGGLVAGRLGSMPAAPPLLTFPSASPETSGGLDDVLPFALDEGTASPFKPRSPAKAPPAAPLASSGGQLPVNTAAVSSPPQVAPAAPLAPAAVAAAATTAAPAQPPVDADAAVGAFVRLIQDAPPLRLHQARCGSAGRAASGDLGSLPGAPAGPIPGTSSGSDSSAATALSDGRGLTLQAGLRQMGRLRERLEQRFAAPQAEPTRVA